MVAIGAVTLTLLGVGTALTGVVRTVVLMIIAIAVAGAAATGTRAVAQTLAVTSAPTNRSGAVSVMLARQFGGAAIAPVLWVPMYPTLGGLTLDVGGFDPVEPQPCWPAACWCWPGDVGRLDPVIRARSSIRAGHGRERARARRKTK